MPDIGVLDELRREHTIILDVVGRLEASVSGEAARPDFVRAAVAFLRAYADANHHGKEEDVLFPVMRRDEFLASLAKMLGAEHEEARGLIAGIEKVIDSRGDARSVSRLVGDYAALIRDHIRREDEMIFGAVESTLDAGDEEEIRREFRRIEAQALGERGVQGLLDDLERVAGV